MLFNSLHFLVFFTLVTTLYYSIQTKFRWILLLVSSAYFYASFIPVYLLILSVIILTDYFAGLWIEKAVGRKRRYLLIISLVVNISFLAFFKYFDFINANISALLGVAGTNHRIPALKEYFPMIALPIGLSFHTFQSMSYTIEVYRGNQRAERHFGIYALYVLFYPQLVAGPIERPQNVIWQFHKNMEYCPENLKAGLWMIIWGMFKKVVIADRLALVTDDAFGAVADQNGSTLLIAVFFYCFQIYCDFSGYSDIALGTARAMGFKLMTNFESPYFSASVSEFWKRWHISLSTWFRDYVYIPLGGNRKSKIRVYFNLMVVFLLSGLWHGADWKFVIWGGIHGVYLILAQVFKSRPNPQAEKGIIKILNIGWTFVLVAFAWIFFRAVNISDAFVIIGKILTLADYSAPALAINNAELIFCLVLIFLLMCKDYYFPDYVPPKRRFWISAFAFSFLCYLFGVFTTNQFIYFQF
ncbi:MBOAT family O-acyltransferase [Dyadobacter bucti]|uniref:MBOAT family O-acyltransferase n=1 Tax=Dyadobacter bucti TaxID=2572203 RepID=UPI001108A7D6|nr:MBOAT family O-acyltransferase [Dyadobacter bucti]